MICKGVCLIALIDTGCSVNVLFKDGTISYGVSVR